MCDDESKRGMKVEEEELESSRTFLCFGTNLVWEDESYRGTNVEEDELESSITTFLCLGNFFG